MHRALPPARDIKGSLSSDVFKRRTSTGSRTFALFSRDFEQTFGHNRLYKSKAT